MNRLKKIKQGHIEAVRKQSEFFLRLHECCKEIERYQYEAQRQYKIVKIREQEIRNLKEENDMLSKNLFEKSDLIYKLQKELDEIRNINK